MNTALTNGKITVTGGSTQTQLTVPTISATASAVTSSSVTLAAPAVSAQDASATVQYRMSSDGGSSYGAWQASPAFTGLTASTTYKFQAKYVAGNTASYTDSDPSAAVSIETSAATPQPGGVDTAAGYGGKVTAAENGQYTVSATQAGYVIDEIWVDGVKLPAASVQGQAAYTTTAAPTRSIFATFAYTLSFNTPANGTLSVSRGAEPLTSGDIVHGGDVLTITATPNSGYEPDAFTLVGLHDNGNGTYTVYGTTAPSIYVSFKSSTAAPVTPTIGTQPAGATYTVGDTATALSVTASRTDTGTLSYQWYSNTSGTAAPATDTSISGATAATYTPSTASAGTTYYYCVVTNTRNSQTATATSNAVAVTVYAGQTYTVTVDSNITHGTVTLAPASTAQAGQTITATPSPEAGYIVDTVRYTTDGSTYTAIHAADGVYSFVMPAGNVTVTASFIEPIKTIASAQELADFAQTVNGGYDYVGQTVTLTDDISLTGAWTPIGNYIFSAAKGKFVGNFSGTFDGGNHTISGLNVTTVSSDYAGLFGYISGATIKNLTVKGAVSCNVFAVGGIVGEAENGSTISNCVNYADVTSSSDSFAGGIVGDTGSGANRIQNCINYGNISSGWMGAGGIAGRSYNSSGSYGSISGCGNYGAVSSMAYAGGIVADLSYGNVDNCFNKGNVSAADTKQAGASAGGIVATIIQAKNVAISNCYNTGNLAGYTNATKRDSEPYVGGIFSGDRQGSTGIVITNCYSTGALTKTGNFTKTTTRYGEIAPAVELTGSNYAGFKETPMDEANCKQVNCYTGSEIIALGTAAANSLGAAYKADENGINANATPLLVFEAGALDTTTQYPVTFHVTGATNYTVTVYTDSAKTKTATVNQNGSYSLTAGQYFYQVSANGYVTENGSFKVNSSDQTISVTLREAATVTFAVTPANAALILKSGTNQAAPNSQTGGVYTFSLYAGDVYTYTVTASGYNGTTREFTAENNVNIPINLSKSSQSDTNNTVKGGETISKGGVYNLKRNSGISQGVITISTAEPVTLVGTGTSLSDVYENLYVDCTVAGVKLTIQNLYIKNTIGSTNMIDFMGKGNYLYFAGVNILDMDTGATGYAMVHVGPTTELTVGGVSSNDTLYFYKREQGAGIGGNGGADASKGDSGQSSEYNGKITITDGNLFMKNSMQGALIGSGAQATASAGSPGTITIEGGVLNLVAISRGAAIGGSAGSTGGATGANVYVKGGTLTINIDWSGSAIGGGGYDKGNDSSGGNLYYSGGSIRTFIDYNAVDSDGNGSTSDTLWPGVTAPGVNDAAITANKVNASGQSVYLCTFDTSKFSGSASTFTVKDGSNILYSGELHQYRYVNENLYKDDQLSINYTIDNWTTLSDPNLYLYLTGADHTLTVNGETFNVTWNSSTSTFTVTKAGSSASASAVVASATLDVKATANGTTSTATVSGSAMTSAVSSAIAAAAKDGSKPTVAIKVDASATSTKVQTTIPASAFASVASSTVQSLNITSPVGSITLDSKAIDSVSSQAKGRDVTLGVAQVDKTTLTAAQKLAVGSGTVIDLSITSGGTAIHDFSGGSATVSVPYTLKSGEKADGIVIWFLSDNGTLTQVEGAKFDSSTGLVTFTVSHFSNYVIGYDPAAAWSNSFTDVSKTDWFYLDTYYVSTNSLFKGTSATEFSPNLPMTRAMFVTVLGRLAGVKESDYTTSSFTDVKTGQWYSAYVEWAAKNGIVKGVGDKLFNPDGQISREEMAAILYRYAQFMKENVSATKDLSAFPDASKTSSWAADAIKWAVSDGLMNGMGDGTLSPQGTASRAQVAAIIHRFAVL